MKKRFILKANLYDTGKGISTWNEMSFDQKKDSSLFAKVGDSVIWEAKTNLFTEGVRKNTIKGLKPEWLEFKGIIKEDESALSHSKQLIKYKDNPVVTAVIEHFKDPKVVKLERIEGVSDVWHIDLSFGYDEADPYQAREEAKGKAYDIKRELEGKLMKDFNLPSMSIQGVGCNDKRCKFSISFIYANKGNHKVNYEAKAKALAKFYLYEADEQQVEVPPTESQLEQEIKNWEVLHKEIEKHENDFRAMIEQKLENKAALEAKVFQMMDALKLKTKKVNFVVAKVKDEYTRMQKPGPKDTLAFALSKVNKNLQNTINNWVTESSKLVPVPSQKSINIDDSITQLEGVGQDVKQGFQAFVSKLKGWWNAAHAYLDSVKEFEQVAKQSGLTEGYIKGSLSDHLTKTTGMQPEERKQWRDKISELFDKARKLPEGPKRTALKKEAMNVFDSFQYWRDNYQNKSVKK